VTINSTFRDRLAQAIEADGRKRETIAERSGYSASYIRRILRGIQQNPTISFAAAMAETLSVSVSWLLGVEAKETNHG